MNVSLKNILEGEKILNKKPLEVVLIDYKKYTKLEKKREKKKDELAYLLKKEHFEEQINRCENMRYKFKFYTEQELIKLKHEILFNKGRYNANMSGINMSILLLIVNTAISVYVMLLEIYKVMGTSSMWIILTQGLIIVISLFMVYYVLTEGKGIIEARYSYNEILLNYQLELVEEELERRKNEKLEVQQLSSRQFNRSSNNKEIRHNRKTRGKR